MFHVFMFHNAPHYRSSQISYWWSALSGHWVRLSFWSLAKTPSELTRRIVFGPTRVRTTSLPAVASTTRTLPPAAKLYWSGARPSFTFCELCGPLGVGVVGAPTLACGLPPPPESFWHPVNAINGMISSAVATRIVRDVIRFLL